MKQQAKKSTTTALAILWLLTVGAGVYQAWPAQYLRQEAPPELPAFEDCPASFEACFARALRTRKNMAADRLEFSEGYASRVRGHLAVGTGVFLLPFGLWWLWSNRRIFCTNGPKLFGGKPLIKTKANVPDGFALVPLEPTPDMIAALEFGGDVALAVGHADISEDVVSRYQAMLRTAPQPRS